MDLPAAGFAAAYNVGVYTNNPDVTITVTTTPFGAAAIPEPSSAFLILLGLLPLARRRR